MFSVRVTDVCVYVPLFCDDKIRGVEVDPLCELNEQENNCNDAIDMPITRVIVLYMRIR